MGISITEHLAHTAIFLDDDDDNKIDTLVVDLGNEKHNQENEAFLM